MVRLLIWLVRRYQAVSRCFFLKACRFHPSCSDYAIEAIRKHGAVHGSWLAVKRIIRCSPLTQGGYDPVR